MSREVNVDYIKELYRAAATFDPNRNNLLRYVKQLFDSFSVPEYYDRDRANQEAIKALLDQLPEGEKKSVLTELANATREQVIEIKRVFAENGTAFPNKSINHETAGFNVADATGINIPSYDLASNVHGVFAIQVSPREIIGSFRTARYIPSLDFKTKTPELKALETVALGEINSFLMLNTDETKIDIYTLKETLIALDHLANKAQAIGEQSSLLTAEYIQKARNYFGAHKEELIPNVVPEQDKIKERIDEEYNKAFADIKARGR